MSIDRLVVWGCGELGSRVARLWMDQGGAVVGITQTDERHAVLEKLGIFPVTAEAQRYTYTLEGLPGGPAKVSVRFRGAAEVSARQEGE